MFQTNVTELCSFWLFKKRGQIETSEQWMHGGASLALCWLVTAECVRGCVGGDAGISAAMTLQLPPVWHPALPHPWWLPRQPLTTGLPAPLLLPPLLLLLLLLFLCSLPCWAYCGLQPPRSRALQVKEKKKKIYVLYESMKKKKGL